MRWIHLTLYKTEGQSFHILFREKIMAGLSGYVEDGRLSAEGIECACAGLLTFRGILQTLAIDRISVFATASLRNISNTEQALSVIHAATGYFVEVISGEEEALFGYAGAMQELRLSSGAFLDIGGASTEIVTFDGGTPVNFASFPIGSLSLYRRCVKKILPGEGSLKRLWQEISQTIDLSEDVIASHPLLIGVGGTARAALKLAQHYSISSASSSSSQVCVYPKRTSYCCWASALTSVRRSCVLRLNQSFCSLESCHGRFSSRLIASISAFFSGGRVEQALQIWAA